MYSYPFSCAGKLRTKRRAWPSFVNNSSSKRARTIVSSHRTQHAKTVTRRLLSAAVFAVRRSCNGRRHATPHCRATPIAVERQSVACTRRLRPGQSLLVKAQSGRELERIEAKASRLRSEVERLFSLAAAAEAKRDPLPGASLGGGGGDASCRRGRGVGGGGVSGRRPATTAGVSGAWRGNRRACGQVRAILVRPFFIFSRPNDPQA